MQQRRHASELRAGARYVVTGNFADFYGKFRIDARVVDVGSGQIIKVVSNSAPELQDRAQMSRIMQDIAAKILTRGQALGFRRLTRGEKPGPRGCRDAVQPWSVV